jgi:Fur family ferric uptake transcriptional regulator
MKKDFKKILKDAGLKATDARLAILSILSEGGAPETAEGIHRKIKKSRLPAGRQGTDFATVYRTLSAFLKSGILKKVDLRRESVYYELADNKNHHHHIVCTNCGLVEDFENRETEKLAEKIAKNSANFKSISEHSFEFFGLCRKCA